MQRFQEVIQRFPKSPLYGDSWMMIGEHYFATSDWVKAKDAYTHVGEEAATSDLATFKVAWCEWKLGDSTQAAKDFKRVLDKAVAAEKSGTEAQRRRSASLREEALEYLVVVFTEDRTISPKEVFDFLVSIDGEQYSRDVMVKVAESYGVAGRVGAQQRGVSVPDQDGSGVDQGRRVPARRSSATGTARSTSTARRRRSRSCSTTSARTPSGPRRRRTATPSPARWRPPRSITRTTATSLHAEAQRREKSEKKKRDVALYDPRSGRLRAVSAGIRIGQGPVGARDRAALLPRRHPLLQARQARGGRRRVPRGRQERAGRQVAQGRAQAGDGRVREGAPEGHRRPHQALPSRQEVRRGDRPLRDAVPGGQGDRRRDLQATASCSTTTASTTRRSNASA